MRSNVNTYLKFCIGRFAHFPMTSTWENGTLEYTLEHKHCGNLNRRQVFDKEGYETETSCAQ